MAATCVNSAHSVSRTLRAYRVGRFDPTTRLDGNSFVRAMRTPVGPATLWCRWPSSVSTDGLTAEAFGPGAQWALDQVDELVGNRDSHVTFEAAHPVVERSLHERRDVRIGASRDLWHALIPIVLAQRITAGEATRQWHRLCRLLAERPPGPAMLTERLSLPPAPASIAALPMWTFHRLDIEVKRARTLVEIARHADALWDWAQQPPLAAAERLAGLSGVGVWTIGCALGPALGDPDAVVVGDFHLPHAVAWALAGEARATDVRMLELLDDYRGQRGRVQSAVVATMGSAPKFGPRQRIITIAAM